MVYYTLQFGSENSKHLHVYMCTYSEVNVKVKCLVNATFGWHVLLSQHRVLPHVLDWWLPITHRIVGWASQRHCAQCQREWYSRSRLRGIPIWGTTRQLDTSTRVFGRRGGGGEDWEFTSSPRPPVLKVWKTSFSPAGMCLLPDKAGNRDFWPSNERKSHIQLPSGEWCNASWWLTLDQVRRLFLQQVELNSTLW